MDRETREHSFEVLETPRYQRVNRIIFDRLKKLGLEFKTFTFGRFIEKYSLMPRLRTPEGFVVSGEENILIYLNRKVRN